MEIRLDKNGFLYMHIREEDIKTYKTEPLELNGSKSKVQKMTLYVDTKTTLSFEKITDKDGNIVVYENEFFDFIEVFNCYLSKQLEKEQEIVISYQKAPGFKAKLATKAGVENLMIQVADSKYFFDKYTCRVIVNKGKHYFNKCR